MEGNNLRLLSADELEALLVLWTDSAHEFAKQLLTPDEIVQWRLAAKVLRKNTLMGKWIQARGMQAIRISKGGAP